MADILIKGWDMPKCCTTEETVECVFAYTSFGEDYMCLLTGEDLKEGKRGKRCPLLEVKHMKNMKDYKGNRYWVEVNNGTDNQG